MHNVIIYTDSLQEFYKVAGDSYNSDYTLLNSLEIKGISKAISNMRGKGYENSYS